MNQLLDQLPFGVDQLIEREASPAPVVYDTGLQMSLHRDAPVIADPSLAAPWMATNFQGDKTAPKWD